MKKQPVSERFMEKVEKDPSTGCWNFTSSISRTGCGRFFYQGKCHDAYRVSWMLFRGDIPTGKHLHHKCENRLCVNPDHLKDLTAKEHYISHPAHLSTLNSSKTHCPNGHLYSENLAPWSKENRRVCLPCSRKRVAEFNRNKRLAKKLIASQAK